MPQKLMVTRRLMPRICSLQEPFKGEEKASRGEEPLAEDGSLRSNQTRVNMLGRDLCLRGLEHQWTMPCTSRLISDLFLRSGEFQGIKSKTEGQIKPETQVKLTLIWELCPSTCMLHHMSYISAVCPRSPQLPQTCHRDKLKEASGHKC